MMTPSLSQNTRGHNLTSTSNLQHLIGGADWTCFHCLDCCFVSLSKWWTHVSSIVTIRAKNYFCPIAYSQELVLNTLLAFGADQKLTNALSNALTAFSYVIVYDSVLEVWLIFTVFAMRLMVTTVCHYHGLHSVNVFISFDVTCSTFPWVVVKTSSALSKLIVPSSYCW